MGTVLCRRGSVNFDQPKRSSIQLRACLTIFTSRSPLTAHDDFFAANIHLKVFKRSRRRTGDVSPVKPIRPIVASAPDNVHVAAVLNRAPKMSTNRGDRVVFALGGEEQ